MLSIDLKKSVPIQFSKPLSSFISNVYKQDPANYSTELGRLDDLRQDCVMVSPTAHGLAVLRKYLVQLLQLTSRFPFDDGSTSIKIPFAWFNFMGKEKKAVSCFSLKFEVSAVLFNMACIMSRMGQLEGRATSDTLKRACNHYMNAAGIYQYICDVYSACLPIPPSTDLSQPALTCLSKLMIAQAQQCFFLKAAIDKTVKDPMMAKLASSTAVLYDAAFDAAQSAPSIFTGPWLVQLQVCALYFHGMASYRKSCDALSRQQYGEEIVRLQDAQVFLEKTKEFQKSTLTEMLNDINMLIVTVTKNLERAQKENKMIYNDPLPSRSALGEIGVATVAKPTPFSIDVSEERPIFEKLVPLSIHQAASEYIKRRDAVVFEIIGEVGKLNEEVDGLLAELGLPGALEAAEQPVGLPEAVVQKSKEVIDLGGSQLLYDAAVNIDRLKDECKSLLDQTEKLLDEEQQQDDKIRGQFGTKWDRQPSRVLTVNLRNNIKTCKETLAAAEASDEQVMSRFDKHIALIESLCSTKEELLQSIPACTDKNTSTDSATISRLRELLARKDEILASRSATIDTIKASVEMDDIVQVLMANSKVDQEQLYKQQLQRYDEFALAVQKHKDTHQEIVQDIRTAHDNFEEARRTNLSLVERKTALQNLDDAYQNFKIIDGNLKEGLRFYIDFTESVRKLLDSGNDFVISRRLEHEDLLHSIQSIAAGIGMAKSESLLSTNLPGTYKPAEEGDSTTAKSAESLGKPKVPSAPAPVNTTNPQNSIASAPSGVPSAHRGGHSPQQAPAALYHHSPPLAYHATAPPQYYQTGLPRNAAMVPGATMPPFSQPSISPPAYTISPPIQGSPSAWNPSIPIQYVQPPNMIPPQMAPHPGAGVPQFIQPPAVYGHAVYPQAQQLPYGAYPAQQIPPPFYGRPPTTYPPPHPGASPRPPYNQSRH